MRDLALKVMCGNIDNDIQINGSFSTPTSVPFDSELVGVAINLTDAVTVSHSWDILSFGGDTGSDIVVPAGFTQGFVVPDNSVVIPQGYRIGLRSNGEDETTSNDGAFSFLFRPLSPRPAGEIWLYGETMSSVPTPGNRSTRQCAPIASKITGWSYSLADGVINADTTIAIIVDGADSGANLLLPAYISGATADAANGFAVPDKEVICKLGGQLESESDGATTSTTTCHITWVLQPDGPSQPAGWLYLPFPGVTDIGGVNNFTDVVTPVSGRVRNLVIHASVPVDVETNFALRVNGVAPTSAPNYVLPVDARDESGTSMPIRNVHDVYVVAGDRLDVLSGGEMSPASVSSGGIWIEPMEGAN